METREVDIMLKQALIKVKLLKMEFAGFELTVMQNKYFPLSCRCFLVLCKTVTTTGGKRFVLSEHSLGFPNLFLNCTVEVGNHSSAMNAIGTKGLKN